MRNPELKEEKPEGYNAYPRTPKTTEELQKLSNAFSTLRRYHRKFHCDQNCILRQYQG